MPTSRLPSGWRSSNFSSKILMKSSKQKRTPAAVAVAAAPPKPRLWPYLVGGVLAIVAAFQAYGPALSGPFLLDDTYLPYMLPNFAHAPLKAWVSGVRPLTNFTFWFNYQR